MWPEEVWKSMSRVKDCWKAVWTPGEEWYEKSEVLEEFFKDKYPQECAEKENYDELYDIFQDYLRERNIPKECTSWLTEVLMAAEIDFIPKLTKVYEGMFSGIKLTEAQCEQVAQLKASLTEELTFPW